MIVQINELATVWRKSNHHHQQNKKQTRKGNIDGTKQKLKLKTTTSKQHYNDFLCA